jgi:hypothetical protein
MTTPAASTEKFVYDKVEPFDVPIDVSLPPKPSKPKRAPAAAKQPKVVLPELAQLQPPKLNRGLYAGAGQCYASRIHATVTYSSEREKVLEEAWTALEGKGIKPMSGIASLHAAEVEEVDAAGKKVKVSRYSQYNRTEGGKAVLADIRDKDQRLKQLSDSLVKSYIKSASSGDLYQRWMINREKKIITEETYYFLETLTKYIIASMLKNFIQFRRDQIWEEIKAIEAGDKDAKHYQMVAVDTKSVRACLNSAGSMRSFPLANWFFQQARAFIDFFPEPVRKTGTAAGAAASAAEPVAETDETDDATNAKNIKCIITELINIVKGHYETEAKKKAETDGKKPEDVKIPSIRISTATKELLNFLAMQFAEKVLCGIHTYVNETKGAGAETDVGVKIDVEELTGRLKQLIYDSTDSRFTADVRDHELAILDSFIDEMSDDFSAYTKHRHAVNDIVYAQKKSVVDSKEKGVAVKYSVADIHALRTQNATKAQEKALAKSAAEAGFGADVEGYKKSLETRAADRKSKKAQAAKRREQEKLDQLQRDKKKLAENDSKWHEKWDEMLVIAKELGSVGPPPMPLVIGGAVAATSESAPAPKAD